MATSESQAVVVTGASTGIGAAVAQYLDERGFRVFATVRKPTDADRIAGLGSSRLQPLFLDVTRAESIADAERTVAAALGTPGLSGLVNNAGMSLDVPLECVDMGELRRQLEVNTMGPAAVTQAFLPLLRRARGRVVNVSSISGRIATPFSGPYCMSKFALEAFTDCLRQELVDRGMHVASIQPGAIDTEIWSKGHEADWSVKASEQELELYREGYQAFRSFEAKNAASAVPCDAVSQAIYHALTARRPRSRYVITTDARLYAGLARICPDRLMDWVTRKVMGLGAVRSPALNRNIGYTMSPLPEYFDLGRYGITPADVARFSLRCEPTDIQENVVITPVWYRDLTAVHGRVVREVSPRVLELDYRGALFSVIRSDIGAPNTGDVVLALGATGCRRLVFTGSVGGLDPTLQIGQLVLPLESITGDGFSRYLEPETVPGDWLLERASPDPSLTRRLEEKAAEVCARDSIALERGSVFSIDSIVAQFSRIDYMRHELDCIGIEMETAATFHAARLVGIEASALLIVSDVIPVKKSLFSGRTQADGEQARSVRRNQLAESVFETLLHVS